MAFLRKIIRLLLLAAHVLLGLFLAALLVGLLRVEHDRPFYQRLVQWWLRRVYLILGVQARVSGEIAPAGTMLVANHISWLDIAVLGGTVTPRFLSKQEVRHWPVIGWLAEQAGTLFIERGRKGAAQGAADTLVRSLNDGRSVLVFPEGTTTDGKDVRRFFNRLFSAAIDTESPVQPIALRYLRADGSYHELVPYIDDQSLIESLWSILGDKRIIVEIHFLPLISIENSSRKELAVQAEESIRSVIVN